MSLSVKSAKQALKLILKTEKQYITPFIKGQPGIGKSEIVKQLKEELTLDHLIDIRMSQHDNTDIKGIPNIHEISNNKVLKWINPEFIPIIGSRWEGTTGILFLDEINRAQPDVLQSIFELVYDRKIGGNKILDDWKIVCAGNLGNEDNTDVHEFDSALNNRFCILHIENVYLDDWVEWAEVNNINKNIIGFLKKNPGYFNIQDKEFIVTPRSWVIFSNLLNNANTQEECKTIILHLGPGIIYSATPQFNQYYLNNQLISCDDILNNYSKVKQKISKDEIDRNTIYGVVIQLVEYIKIKSLDKKQNMNVISFINEILSLDHKIVIIKMLQKENKMDLIKNILDSDKDLYYGDEFRNYIIEAIGV